MRHRLERVPEKDQEIDLALCDLRSDLLIATQRPALQLDDLEIEFLLQQFSRCSRRIELMMTQEVSVKPCPFEQILFFIVMSNERDLFYLLRYFRLIFHLAISL